VTNEWRDILDEQPEQGERLLVKLIGGAVRITSYDRFSYEQWCITHFKRIPEKKDALRVV
jgi:hypothetical protein